MKIYKLSAWLKILVWFLLAALGMKLLCILRNMEHADKARHVHVHGPQGKLKRLSRVHHGARPAYHEKQKAKPHEEPLHEPHELEKLLHSNRHYNWSHDDNQGQCAPYPRMEDLHIESVYYQHSKGGNVSYYLHSAYYDRRLAMENSPSIKILGMISSISGPYPNGYCQVWYKHSSKPELMSMQKLHVSWHESWGTFAEHVYPVELTCPLVGNARRHRLPQLVSLVFDDRCSRPTNALRVLYEAPKRRHRPRFGVCVKDLVFPNVDMSERFVEWLELMRLLGAERVIAYDLGGNTLLPNTRRTLQHYTRKEQESFLELRPFRMLGPEGSLMKCLNEVLMYNDCLYRNMYDFDYLAVMDVDEVIMPLNGYNNWTALVERLEHNSNGDLNSESINPHQHCMARCSFCFRNVYFSRELPQDETPPASFYMLRHVQRVAEHLKANMAPKCLHATAYVTSLHNHFPMDWREACGPHDVSISLGQMQHYREPDIPETLKVPPPVRDDNIWRFKEQLISNALAVHRQLGWQP